MWQDTVQEIGILATYNTYQVNFLPKSEHLGHFALYICPTTAFPGVLKNKIKSHPVEVNKTCTVW